MSDHARSDQPWQYPNYPNPESDLAFPNVTGPQSWSSGDLLVSDNYYLATASPLIALTPYGSTAGMPWHYTYPTVSQQPAQSTRATHVVPQSYMRMLQLHLLDLRTAMWELEAQKASQAASAHTTGVPANLTLPADLPATRLAVNAEDYTRTLPSSQGLEVYRLVDRTPLGKELCDHPKHRLNGQLHLLYPHHLVVTSPDGSVCSAECFLLQPPPHFESFSASRPAYRSETGEVITEAGMTAYLVACDRRDLVASYLPEAPSIPKCSYPHHSAYHTQAMKDDALLWLSTTGEASKSLCRWHMEQVSGKADPPGIPARPLFETA